jgi:hypothetical protein
LPLSTIAAVRTKILCAWLIEIGLFMKFFVIFLIKGHTKNPCDHLVNALKRFYRVQNIETLDDWVVILNKNDDVVAIEVTPEGFHDSATMFKEQYINFPAVLKYHLFDSENIEHMSMLVGNGYAQEQANLKLPRKEEDQIHAE